MERYTFAAIMALLSVAVVAVMAMNVDAGFGMQDDRREDVLDVPSDGTIVNGTEVVTLSYNGPSSSNRPGELPYGGLPQAYSGTGPGLTNRVLMNGTVTFNVTYRGTGPLNVTLWADDGSCAAVLIDASYEFYGQHTAGVSVDLDLGAYRVSVDGSGYWFVSMK